MKKINKITKTRIYKILRILIAIGLLIFLFSKINILDVLNNLKHINWIILIPLFLYIPALFLLSLRFSYLLDKKKKINELFKLNWVSAFFSNFLPSNIGGDSYKVIKLKKEFGLKKALSSVFIDRIYGLLSIFVIYSLMIFFFYKEIQNNFLIFIPLFIFVGLIIILSFPNIKFFKKLKFYDKIVEAHSSFNKNFFRGLSISLLFTLLGAISLYLYYLMFGFNLQFGLILLFYCIIQIMNMIPISINSIGIQESVSIYLFSLIGIPAEISLSISILSRLVMILQTSIGGIIYLFSRSKC